MDKKLNGIFSHLDISGKTGLASKDNYSDLTAFQKLFYTQARSKIGVDAVYFLRDEEGTAKIPLIYFSMLEDGDPEKAARLHSLSWNKSAPKYNFLLRNTIDDFAFNQVSHCPVRKCRRIGCNIPAGNGIALQIIGENTLFLFVQGFGVKVSHHFQKAQYTYIFSGNRRSGLAEHHPLFPDHHIPYPCRFIICIQLNDIGHLGGQPQLVLHGQSGIEPHNLAVAADVLPLNDLAGIQQGHKNSSFRNRISLPAWIIVFSTICINDNITAGVGLTMDSQNIPLEDAQFALRQSWEIHRQAFGPILEPAFQENQQVRILLINALNHISRREVSRGMEILKEIAPHCIYDEDKAAWAFL